MSKEHKPFMKNFFMKKGFMRKDMEKLNDRDYEEFLADEDAWKILDKYGLSSKDVNYQNIEPAHLSEVSKKAYELINQMHEQEKAEIERALEDVKILIAETTRREILLNDKAPELAIKASLVETLKYFENVADKDISPADLMEEVMSGHDMVNLATKQYLVSHKQHLKEAFLLHSDEMLEMFTNRYEQRNKDKASYDYKEWAADLSKIREERFGFDGIARIPAEGVEDFFNSVTTSGWISCEDFEKKFMELLDKHMEKLNTKTPERNEEPSTDDHEL